MSTSRRDLLRCAVVLGAARLLPAAGGPGNLLLLSKADAEKIRARLPAEKSAALRKMAAKAFETGPWSITFHRPARLKLQPGEFFSEGPYWWPDPKNPNGPYTRRDGLRNPARFVDNRKDLDAMSANVMTLGMAAYFLSDRAAVSRAKNVLATWFINPKTAMLPSLDHGQAIRGIDDGRYTGLIDAVNLIHCAQGVALLEAGGLDAATAAGVRKWYANFLAWMTDTRKGRTEQHSRNNHATWWGAQVATYATFTGDSSRQQIAWDLYRNSLINQIEADGSCPREEVRTTSLSYSALNLDAFTTLCTLARRADVDLWRVKNTKGASVSTGAFYLAPFVQNPERWKHAQITPFQAKNIVFPGLAAVGLPAKELMKTHLALPRAKSPWVMFIDLLIQNRT